MSKQSPDGWVRVFEVCDPTRHRKGHTIYKVISRLFATDSVEGVTEIVTWKRYNEFKELHKALSSLHHALHLKGVVPSFPEAKLFGRFDDEVIETRRRAALELLQFAASHPPLFTNSVFVAFFDNATTNCTLSANTLLPHPLEPNVSPHSADNHSAISDTSDGSSYYSTPLHSTESSTQVQSLTISGSDLSQFDPLVSLSNEITSNSSLCESKQNDWFMYAIQSCDDNRHSSHTSHFTPTDNDNEQHMSLPQPFTLNDCNSNSDSQTTNNNCVENISNSSDLSDIHLADNKISNFLNENDVTLNSCENTNQIDRESTNESVDDVDSNDTYLVDAATLIVQAQQHEESCEYEAAFESYKCAVGILLNGVRDESESTKKASIRRKTFQYLTRAEQIYDCYLNGNDSLHSNRRWAPDSPFKSLTASLVSSWFGSWHELSKLKVVGVLNRVQLVIDPITKNIFVLKVIYKSNAINTKMHTMFNNSSLIQNIFPQDIPFMVQIYRIFRTEYALFLLLEFAKGGKLWDHIFLGSSDTLSPCPDCTFADDGSDDTLISNNVYSGRRLVRTKSESAANENCKRECFSEISELKTVSSAGSLESIESIEYDTSSKSYLTFCTKYAYSQNFEQSGGLANCKLNDISVSIDSIDSIDSITECDSKAPDNYTKRSKGTSLVQSMRQLSTESLGISSLLAKARDIIKNVDETLRVTKHVALNRTKNIISNNIRETKSEINLSQSRSRQISEVFHHSDSNGNSTNCSHRVNEEKAKVWLSQIIKCLQHLHKLGIIYCDLKPENILLSEDNNIKMTYKCFWNELPHHVIDEMASERLFVAPEFKKSGKVSDLCDWWSVGVITYELLTSRALVSFYPNGINSHTLLYFPEYLSLEAKDLLTNLLQPNPRERIGRHGPEEITAHPFFADIDWQ